MLVEYKAGKSRQPAGFNATKPDHPALATTLTSIPSEKKPHHRRVLGL